MCSPHSWLNRHPQRGAAMLAAILVVTAATLAIALSVSLGSLGGLTTAFGAQQSAASFAVADGCVEEALLRLLWDGSYAGGTVSLGSAMCQVAVTAAGSNRTVHATSTQATFVRKLRVDLTRSGAGLTITGWQEKTD